MKIYRRTLKCVLVWDMELGPVARGLMARVGVGRAMTAMVVTDTAIVADPVVDVGCSTVAS